MMQGTEGAVRPPGGPRVSVVLPAFNAGRHVAAAVRSMLEQTFTGLEVVVIDDGSTDVTPRVLQELAAGDDRIRVVQRANRGLTRSLNEGLALAAAPFVAIMNADDIALPERLARQVAYLEAHPAVAAVGGQTRCFLDDGTVLGPRTRLPVEPAAVRACLAEVSPLAHPSVMVRAAALRAVGGYRPQLEPAEDYDLWLRLAERHDLANLPDVVLHYRLHPAQATAAAFERVALATLVAREAARRRASGAPDPVDTRTHRMPPGAADETPRSDHGVLDGLAASLGITPAAVATSAIHAALGRGESLLAVGATPTVVRGALGALALSRSAAVMPTLYRAARNWLEGRILAAGGRHAVAVPRFVEAALAEPAFRSRLAGAVGRRINAAMSVTRREPHPDDGA